MLQSSQNNKVNIAAAEATTTTATTNMTANCQLNVTKVIHIFSD